LRVTIARRNREIGSGKILIGCRVPKWHIYTRRLFLELWVPPNKLMIHIARQVLETIYRKSGKLLASLIPLWMKFFTGGKKVNLIVIRIGLSPYQFIIDICR